MSKQKKFLIDEKTVEQLQDIVALLAVNESQVAFFELSSVVHDIITWCEVKDKK